MTKAESLALYRQTQALLTARRKALGLTQAEVSERMQRGERYVTQLEATWAPRVPAHSTIIEWAAALQLHISWEATDAGQE